LSQARERLTEGYRRHQAQFAEMITNDFLQPGETLLTNYLITNAGGKNWTTPQKPRNRPQSFRLGIACLVGFVIFLAITIGLLFFSSSPIDYDDSAEVFSMIFFIAICAGTLIGGIFLIIRGRSPQKSALVFITDKRLCIYKKIGAQPWTEEKMWQADMLAEFNVMAKSNKSGTRASARINIATKNKEVIELKPPQITFADTVAALDIVATCHQF